jgi:SNF2 family DNA or RNA helicase
LPEKNIIDELIEMNDDQRNFYNDILSGVFDKLDKVSLNDN